MLKKIISGGQTGADRAALDAALEANFPCGGFCPKNRQAEDGPIDPKYPLTEINGGYPERTEQNVIHSDGTIIFYDSQPSGGTLLTIEQCRKRAKPYLLIDISNIPEASAKNRIAVFVRNHSQSVLNVAGSRASECAEVYSYVKSTIYFILYHI